MVQRNKKDIRHEVERTYCFNWVYTLKRQGIFFAAWKTVLNGCVSSKESNTSTLPGTLFVQKTSKKLNQHTIFITFFEKFEFENKF